MKNEESDRAEDRMKIERKERGEARVKNEESDRAEGRMKIERRQERRSTNEE